jgi:hypothetical protein
MELSILRSLTALLAQLRICWSRLDKYNWFTPACVGNALRLTILNNVPGPPHCLPVDEFLRDLTPLNQSITSN